MILYFVLGAIGGGIDPYYSKDGVASIVLYIGFISIRILAIAATALLTRFGCIPGDLVSNQVSATRLTLLVLSIMFFLGCICDLTSPFLVDRAIVSVLAVFILIAFHFQNRRQAHAKEQQVIQEVYASQQGSEIIDCGDNNIVHNDDNVYDILESSPGMELSIKPISNHPEVRMERQIPTTSTNSSNDNNLSVAELAERAQKRSLGAVALFYSISSQVTGLYCLLQLSELCFSMYLYEINGVPPPWCAPFSWTVSSFNSIQILVDFFL